MYVRMVSGIAGNKSALSAWSSDGGLGLNSNDARAHWH
jgi:hypothetical protein